MCSYGPAHGYDVARLLLEAGLGEVKSGTLYPVLGRLEDQGLVASHWAAGGGGPGRKVIEASEAGQVLATRSGASGPAGSSRYWTMRRDSDHDSTTVAAAGFEAMVDSALQLGRGDPVVGLGYEWRALLGLALMVAASVIIPLAHIIDPRTGRPFFPIRRTFVLVVLTFAVLVTVAFLGVGLALR